MFIQVLLLKGYSQPLLYAVPPTLQKTTHIGSIVRVPIQKRSTSAFVVNIMHNIGQTSFAIRDIEACQPLPDDTLYIPFITQLAYYHQTQPLHYVKRIYQFIKQKPAQELAASYQPMHIHKDVTLTQEQQGIVDALTAHMHQNKFQANLLHGVTGSGKTEVYKKLLLLAYQQKKSALLLLPEVTLALQFEQLLKAQMPSDVPIFSFHCATCPKSKKILWQRLLNKQPLIIIGVHLPILLPLPNLRLIIVDEEHEAGYQEKKHPKTNTREAALLRAYMYNIPILLGSATPCLSSLYNVKKRGWNFFTLSKRFAGSFPTIKLVSLSNNKQRQSFWISKELIDEINKRLACNEQTILFLNRRGHSFFVQCKQCSFIFSCTHCSVSLTLHDDKRLICHYCGLNRLLPAACLQCKADEKDFIKKGIGTQQLMSIVQKLFPHARIARADMDTTSKKKKWQETITQFHNRELDILIGTQTITKGYDFAHVTLVGIIWADLNLHFPRYNATETTLQQLIQVAGRAGRKKDKSLVIVQTIADHDAFNYLQETDYLTFYQQEIAAREHIGYPPCVRLVEIEFKHHNEHIVDEESKRYTHVLLEKIETMHPDVKLLGPTAPPISKIKNAHTRVIFLKHAHMRPLQELFQSIDSKKYKSNIYFTPNPQ